MKLIIIIILNLIITNKQAVARSFTDFPSTEYRIGLYKDYTIDIEKITHLIIVGSAAKEDSDQFFQSGISRAYRYKELYPSHQVVFISSPDVLNRTDEEVFNKYEVIIVKKVFEKLISKNMINEMNIYNRIASIDFFGHASPWALKIGDMNSSFSPYENQEELQILKEKLLPNAYANLNACNTGFTIAPDLSEILGIPVSGSLTSSMFETIESDGKWYKELDAKNENSIEHNSFSYNQSVLCSLGLCTRMKSSRDNYSSVWGNFKEGGLSFSKFFCKFENNDGRCEKGMANSLISFPSILPLKLYSNREDFELVALDWLCSTAKDRSSFSNCTKGIKEAITRRDLVFQSHPKNELMCDFNSCRAKVLCKLDSDGDPLVGTCHLKTHQNPEPTNIVREFISIMEGFKQLKVFGI